MKGVLKMDKKLLDVKEVAELLGVSMVTVHRMKREGKIPYIKIGGSLKFDREDIYKWIESLKQSDKK
jgi:excisionase family DNA binding protein